MDGQLFYYNLGKRNKELELNFMISSLLKSRLKVGLPTLKDKSEEYVNIYLANLLLSFACPEFRERLERYVFTSDVDIFKMLEESQDNVLKYFVYKINADNLLMGTSIFHSLTARCEGRFFARSEDFYIGQGKVYYESAAAYNTKIYRKTTAIGEVFEKLSRSFEEYVEILSNMKKEYFTFMKKISKGEFSGFVKEMKGFEEQLFLMKKRDELLDAYSEWLKKKDKASKAKVSKLAQELQIIDPDFNFRLAA